MRALAAIIGCDSHPVNNRRILDALCKDFGADESAIDRWCASWIGSGFDAVEALLAADIQHGAFCFGQAPTLADVYLVPQVESARRFKIGLARWALIGVVDAACGRIDAFSKVCPALQPDAPERQ